MEGEEFFDGESSGMSLNRGETLGSKNQEGMVSKSVEKGRETRFHFERVLNFDYCLLVFSAINIVLSVIYSDAEYFGKVGVARVCLYFMSGTLVAESIPLISQLR